MQTISLVGDGKCLHIIVIIRVIIYKLIKNFPSYFNSQKINFGTYDNYIPGKKEFNIYF